MTELLNGNAKRRNKQEVSEEISVDYDDDEVTVESNDFPREPTSSPLRYGEEPTVVTKTPVGGKQSVQGFLMNKKTKTVPEPEVISLDNEDDEFMMAERKVTYPSSFKKTSLKELFNNFRQPDVKFEKEGSVQTDMHASNGPLQRFHEISQLTELEAPLPTCQLIQCDPEIHHRSINFARPNLSQYQPPQFDSKDYAFLRSEEYTQELEYATMMVDEVKSYNVWPQLNKPESLQQVMLETSMKKAVYEWIDNAFAKLKNNTNRSKLLTKKQFTDGFDKLDDFIVEDEAETEDASFIEFVPLMILFGEGIGKNTLIEVIMQMMEGQIYEINTSNNRAKKDILDNLLEFSTTHYVKGQGSKGIILLDDVDIIFKEHDKFFWGALERLLWQSRRPVVLTCRDLSLIPNNLVHVAQQEQSIFHARRVSDRTANNFLRSFCTNNGIVPNDKVLNHLAVSTCRDIRKSLMALQFYCQPPGKFSLGQQQQHTAHNLSLDEAVHYCDLFSHSDILSTNRQWKSSFLQDKDLTLLSYESRFILDSISDDQERLRHDYMIDNKVHLVDDNKRPLLPFELDVGGYLGNHLSTYQNSSNSLGNSKDKKFNKMNEASIAFLSSRITKKEFSINNITRKTRNSKKLRQMLEGFQGNYPESITDESIKLNFETTDRIRLSEYINPYVFKIAESDWNKRKINIRMFKQAVEGLSEGEYFNAVGQLSQDGMFKHPYFEADPKLVIDSWK